MINLKIYYIILIIIIIYYFYNSKKKNEYYRYLEPKKFKVDNNKYNNTTKSEFTDAILKNKTMFLDTNSMPSFWQYDGPKMVLTEKKDGKKKTLYYNLQIDKKNYKCNTKLEVLDAFDKYLCNLNNSTNEKKKSCIINNNKKIRDLILQENERVIAQAKIDAALDLKLTEGVIQRYYRDIEINFIKAIRNNLPLTIIPKLPSKFHPSDIKLEQLKDDDQTAYYNLNIDGVNYNCKTKQEVLHAFLCHISNSEDEHRKSCIIDKNIIKNDTGINLKTYNTLKNILQILKDNIDTTKNGKINKEIDIDTDSNLFKIDNPNYKGPKIKVDADRIPLFTRHEFKYIYVLLIDDKCFEIYNSLELYNTFNTYVIKFSKLNNMD